MLGDVDGNGIINTIDLTIIQRHILEINAIDDKHFKAADVNKDKILDSRDYMLVRRYILEIIDSFKK